MNNFFEDGEIRIGVQSPGAGWVRLDGSRITLKNKKIVKKLTSIFWNTQTSNFGTSAISSVAYGNGVWVAGGSGGTLRTSTDNAVTWNTQTSNFGTSIIVSVAYGNGVWVAGGSGGPLRTSTNDAVTWNTRTTNFGTSTIFSVAYGNGVWVAGGGLGTLRTSTERVHSIAALTTIGGYTWWIKT